MYYKYTKVTKSYTKLKKAFAFSRISVIIDIVNKYILHRGEENEHNFKFRYYVYL